MLMISNEFITFADNLELSFADRNSFSIFKNFKNQIVRREAGLIFLSRDNRDNYELAETNRTRV